MCMIWSNLSLLLEHVPFAQSVEGWDVETSVLEKHLELLTSMITVGCPFTGTFDVDYQTGRTNPERER
jgi:hypothetical protein